RLVGRRRVPRVHADAGHGVPVPVRRGVPLPQGPVGVLVTSVVIPAHNEAAVIGRLLTAILADAGPDEFEIVVVPNGCTDDTAAVASSFGVRVVETEVASKVAALRLGDASVKSFPRIYVDADV